MELQTVNNVVCDINTYYSFNNIYKSLIVCNTDNDVNILVELMRVELYSVYKITCNDLDNNYIKDLVSFNNEKYRVIIISYDVWSTINKELELYILPEQNLIILNLLEEIYTKNIINWIFDTLRRGFISRQDSCILNIMNDHTNNHANDHVNDNANDGVNEANIQYHFKQQLLKLPNNCTVIRNNAYYSHNEPTYVF